MNYFTINGKEYKAKEFDFNLICELEDMGISLEKAAEKPMSMVRAYFGICANMGKDRAGKEMEQHIIGGGKFDDIMKAMSAEMEKSDFFSPAQRQDSGEESSKGQGNGNNRGVNYTSFRERCETELLPYALTIGMREWEFWASTMRRFNAHIKSFKDRQRMIDECMWTMGIYVQSATTTAVEHNLAGRKARSKYLEKPLLEQAREKQGTDMGEDELQKYRNLFVAKLQVMQSNYEISHKKKKKEAVTDE